MQNITAILSSYVLWHIFNSLWPSEVIWRHRSGSTSVQLMACCWLGAQWHYLNQRWVLINEVLCHSPESEFTASIQANTLLNYFGNYRKISSISLTKCRKNVSRLGLHVYLLYILGLDKWISSHALIGMWLLIHMDGIWQHTVPMKRNRDPTGYGIYTTRHVEHIPWISHANIYILSPCSVPHKHG